MKIINLRFVSLKIARYEVTQIGEKINKVQKEIGKKKKVRFFLFVRGFSKWCPYTLYLIYISCD